MRSFFKIIIGKLIKPLAKSYFSKPRNYSYKNIKGKVLPEVFHPQFTISTKILLQFLNSKDLKNKSVLELGCGTGFVSVLAAQKGANVLATDINPKALENTKLNAQLNKVNLQSLKSDLFDDIQNQRFDYIVINPPYYPKDPTTTAEKAWFCGAEFQYFEKLFQQLPNYFNGSSNVFMILSEDCELDRIQEIAKINGIKFKEVLKKKKGGEWSFIYELERI
jgi:release factor glutamine methyltransferase